jgi:hypothetical protein
VADCNASEGPKKYLPRAKTKQISKFTKIFIQMSGLYEFYKEKIG